MDESYVISCHVQQKFCGDISLSGLLTALSKGQCLNIIHAGGENSFIPSALVVWKFHQPTGDYHYNISQDNYEKWVKEKLVPNLLFASAVVIVRPYHNITSRQDSSVQLYRAALVTKMEYSIRW
jgi:hypothetical protein